MKKTTVFLLLALFINASAAWRIKTNPAGGKDGEVQFNDAGRLSSHTNFFEAAMSALLMSQTNEFLEAFDSTWSDAGGDLWTNETGWTASGATFGAGEVTLGSSGAYIQSPKTSSGFASVELDKTIFGGATYRREKSTDGTTWEPASGGGSNVFLRLSFAGGAPTFGGAPYVTIHSAQVNGFDYPERYGLINSFAGRDMRVEEAVHDDNPIPLVQFNAGIIAAHGAKWATWPASADVDLSGHRMEAGEDYYIQATTNGLEIGWNRNPIIQVSGGATDFVNPYITRFSANNETNTMTVLGSTGWEPGIEYKTNLFQVGWFSMSTNDFSSTYPVLSDGQYTLTWNTPTEQERYYRATATLDGGAAAGGTNLVVIRYDCQIDGTLIYDGIPTNTNGLAPFSVWCDTNQNNTLKVVLP